MFMMKILSHAWVFARFLDNHEHLKEIILKKLKDMFNFKYVFLKFIQFWNVCLILYIHRCHVIILHFIKPLHQQEYLLFRTLLPYIIV
jgi:hypothetical protein